MSFHFFQLGLKFINTARIHHYIALRVFSRP